MADNDNMEKEIDRKFEAIRQDLHKTIVDQIKEEFKIVKEYVSEIFGKDIARIDKSLEESTKKHTEHYNDHEKLMHIVYDTREVVDNKIRTITEDKFKLLETKIEVINDKQIRIIAQTQAQDITKANMKDQQYKDNEEKDRRKNLIVAIFIGGFTIFTTLIGAIFYLATKIG